jgi:hypothetical protein
VTAGKTYKAREVRVSKLRVARRKWTKISVATERHRTAEIRI